MKVILRLLLGCSFLGLASMPARADFATDLSDFMKGNVTVLGMVSYVQQNHFIVCGADNQMVRVFLQPGQAMPTMLQPGMRVQAVIHVDPQTQTTFLDRIQAVQGPAGMMPVQTSDN